MTSEFHLPGRNKYSEWIKKYHSQDIFPIKFDKNLGDKKAFRDKTSGFSKTK